MDFRKSDMMDDLFNRYLESYELTLETETTIGPVAYRYMLDIYTKNLKEDVKFLEENNKKYDKFKKIERNHEIKLENLDFDYASTTEYVSYNLFQRCKYNRRRRKYERLMKKFAKVLQKYRDVIPECYYNNNMSEELTPPIEERTEYVEPSIEIHENNAGVTDLSAENVAEATEEIQEVTFVEDEQIEMRLEDLFGDVKNNDNEEDLK